MWPGSHAPSMPSSKLPVSRTQFPVPCAVSLAVCHFPAPKHHRCYLTCWLLRICGHYNLWKFMWKSGHWKGKVKGNWKPKGLEFRTFCLCHSNGAFGIIDWSGGRFDCLTSAVENDKDGLEWWLRRRRIIKMNVCARALNLIL